MLCSLVNQMDDDSSPRLALAQARQQAPSRCKALPDMDKRLEFKNRLNGLKHLARGDAAHQTAARQYLESIELAGQVKQAVAESGAVFELHQLYDLITELRERTPLDTWHLIELTGQVILFSQYQAIFPGVRFVRNADGDYIPKAFNYNIRRTF